MPVGWGVLFEYDYTSLRNGRSLLLRVVLSAGRMIVLTARHLPLQTGCTHHLAYTRTFSIVYIALYVM